MRRGKWIALAAGLAATSLTAGCTGPASEVALGPRPGATEPNAAAQQIRTIGREMQESFRRRDANAVARMYTDDGVLVLGDGRVNRGRDNIARAVDGWLRLVDRQFSNYQVTWEPTDLRMAESGDLAYEFGQFTESWDGGRRGGPYLIVWEFDRRARLWRILRDIGMDP